MKTTVSQSSSASWHIIAASHPGARGNQEDAMQTWTEESASAMLVVVADGAGGHGGGEIASQTAVEEAGRHWQKLAPNAEGADFLTAWLAAAHAAINDKTGKQREGARAAAVALLARGRRADWVHAGDCRLYHFRSGTRLFRTRDDSVVQVLCDQGEIKEEEMGRHEDQNRLLQSLGGPDAPRPRLGGADLEPGDVFLLCSDGLWENLAPDEIAQLASAPPARWRQALESAMSKAVAAGGARADNTTAVLAGFECGASARGGWACLLRLAVLFFALLSLLLAGFLALGGKVDELREAGWLKQLQLRMNPPAPLPQLPDEPEA